MTRRQLTGGVKQWVQSELGDYIKINGKTVSAWNEIEFNSAQVHVKTNQALGGQYLEINLSGLKGLPAEDTDNTVEILKGISGVWESGIRQDVYLYV